MTENRWSKRILFAAALMLVLGVWPVVFNKLTAADRQMAPLSFQPAFAHALDSNGNPVSLPEVAERAVKSVVSITGRGAGGSGVIVDASGLILTNDHVVARERRFSVSLSDGREFTATVVGRDASTDLAVLKPDKRMRGLTPIELADSNRVRLGEVVLAIGNPFNVGQTVTMGIVSAKERAADGYIQTDAAINPGNSGGALINLDGKLVGVNRAILSPSGGNNGIGFAIPSNTARPVFESLVKFGKVNRAWLGVGIQDVDADLARELGLPVSSGVLLNQVVDASPARKAGLRTGDVVVRVRGERVKSAARLQRLVSSAGVGSTVPVEAYRDGKKLTFNVTLSARNDDRVARRDAAPAPNRGTPSADSGPLGGIAVKNLNQRLRRQYNVDPRVRAGVVITGVADNSQAGFFGLQEGDVIVELQRKPVKNERDFRRLYRGAGNRVLLLINRDGVNRYMVLESR